MFRRATRIAGFVIAGLAIASRAKGDRGAILGIPFDWRRPTAARAKPHVWNPDEPRLFVPRAYGLGWDINVARLLRR